MKKRILCLLMAAVMAAGLVVPISAAGAVPEEEAAQVVGALNIMVGDEKGNLNLEKDVTRAEFITMAVKASVYGDKVGQASTSPYPDVPRTHWSAGFVQTGVQMGLIAGYLDGTFRPDNKITLAEGATIALKLLGYTSADFVGAYPTAQMTMYRSMDLDKGLSAQNAGDVLDRRDSMYLFYNLLSAKNKQGQYHLNTLGYSLNANGEVDRVALLGQVMDGPIVAGDGWKSQIPFSLTGELLLMLLAFEILLEAGGQMPQEIGQAVSIVGGLILGSAAVEAKIVSPLVVILVAVEIALQTILELRFQLL